MRSYLIVPRLPYTNNQATELAQSGASIPCQAISQDYKHSLAVLRPGELGRAYHESAMVYEKACRPLDAGYALCCQYMDEAPTPANTLLAESLKRVRQQCGE